MKINPKLPGIAIPFFTREQWIAARSVMDDSQTFMDDYEEFVQRVTDSQQRFARQGHRTELIYVDVHHFAAWCRRTGRKVNSESRAHFAALKSAGQDTNI
jgi:hypothetical protein